MRPITSRDEPSLPTRAGRAKDTGVARPPAPGGDDLIELLFFAYRDFVGDPDRILADYGFGRAHPGAPFRGSLSP